MKHYFIQIVIIVAATMLLNGCAPEEKYPPEPEIKYKGFVKLVENPNQDTRGVLIFSFTDGDGDIGLHDDEREPPYDYNLFVKYLEMQNGEIVEVPLIFPGNDEIPPETLSFNARIPMLTPTGKYKGLEGEIRDTLFILNPNSDFDTIFFEVYIRDRALNESNRITTPPIVVNK